MALDTCLWREKNVLYFYTAGQNQDALYVFIILHMFQNF